MSNRIAQAFIDETGAPKKAFIPFITCGDPNLETTRELVLACERAGADLIELGVPFSDPTAEGPVIQQANVRALAGGVTTDKVIDLVAELRKETQIPLVFMTYANVVYSYGTGKALPNGLVESAGRATHIKSQQDADHVDEQSGVRAFCRRAAEAGIDGLILPDVPFEEKEEFAAPCREVGMELISMIAPTSEDRVARIARAAEGFVYCVSSLGVTGVRSQITTDVGAMVQLVRSARAEAGLPPIPCAIGFGISTPDQAHTMANASDGAIVGSAIVRIIAEHGQESVPFVENYVREMKEAVLKD